MNMHTDTLGQFQITWDQVLGYAKRAWLQHRTGENDWAGTGRYLNVVRMRGDGSGMIGGNATDFPIFRRDISDEQVLKAAVYAVNVLTGRSTSKEEGLYAIKALSECLLSDGNIQ